MQNSPYFSVLIVAHNEEKKLKTTLEYVISQNFPADQYEILLIDDESGDRTSLIAHQFKLNFVRLNHRVGASEARRIGINKCRGEIIIFLDAHLSLVDPSSFSKLREIFSTFPNIGGVCGKYQSQVPYDFNQIRDLRREIFFNKKNHRILINYDNFTTFTTAIGAVRKKIFTVVNFPKKFRDSFGEDTYFQLQAHAQGWNFLYAPEIYGFHDDPQNFCMIWKKLIFEIRGTANILYWGSKEQLFLPYLSYFLDYPLFLFTSMLFCLFGQVFKYIFCFILLHEFIRTAKCFTIHSFSFKTKFFTAAYLIIREAVAIIYVPCYILFKYKPNAQQIFKIYLNLLYWEKCKYEIKFK